MVKKLNPADTIAIREAVEATEKQTSAKIRVIVLAQGDRYQDLVWLHSFLLGSIVSVLLWANGETHYPLLLGTQLMTTILADLVLPMRLLSVWLVPRGMRNRRVRKAAWLEYLTLHAEMPKDEPFILLFVSLAERYVHVITNPIVHAKIPGNWETVTNGFTSRINEQGLKAACLQGIGHIVEIVSPYFPKNN